MIGIILLLIAGAFVAYLIDVHMIKNRPAIELEGDTLMRVLKESEQYENIRRNQEAHRARSDHRSIDSGGSVEQLGDGGDGGKVLRFDSRR